MLQFVLRVRSAAHVLVALVAVGSSAAAAASSSSGSACDLQGRYLIFFGPAVANPLDQQAQPRGMAARAAGLVAAIAAGWQHNQSPLLIAGHSDAEEARTARQHLDMDRAEAVRDALIRAGVDPDAIWLRADGLHNALLPDSKGSEIQNRFVSVTAPEASIDCPHTPIP